MFIRFTFGVAEADHCDRTYLSYEIDNFRTALKPLCLAEVEQSPLSQYLSSTKPFEEQPSLLEQTLPQRTDPIAVVAAASALLVATFFLPSQEGGGSSAEPAPGKLALAFSAPFLLPLF